jgi:hypothetical protein
MQGTPVSCQADPRIGVDATNDPALMVVHSVGAGHHGTVPQGRLRVPVPVCHHQQVHKVAESNHCSQDQQAIHSQVYQVNRLQVQGPK